jgi:hypothetical protein
MKKLALVTASVAAMLIAGAAAAQNFSNVNQSGNNNVASVDQATGTNEASGIVQSSDGNSATVIQSIGDSSASDLDQTSYNGYTGNIAQISQYGTSSFSVVHQAGYNGIFVFQGTSSLGENAYVSQTGYNPNGGEVGSNGSNNFGWVMQTGNFNYGVVIQQGNGEGYAGGLFENAIPGILNASDFGFRQGAGSEQVGDYNTALIYQYADASLAVTEATGTGNYQQIFQNTSVNQATGFFVTTGTGNDDNLYQWSGSPYSGASQIGNYNTITVNQSGSSTSIIGQGTNIDGAGLAIATPIPTSYAVATVNQTGDANISSIQQFDAATATVTQVSASMDMGNQSDVLQNVGSTWSTATVDQEGAHGQSEIIQQNIADAASVTQSAGSNSENSFIDQEGVQDSATIVQSGSGESSHVTQTGNYDVVQSSQTGSGNTSTITQSGDWNTAVITQQNTGASSIITQSGAGNSVTIHQ